jgi:hypothetical protein
VLKRSFCIVCAYLSRLPNLECEEISQTSLIKTDERSKIPSTVTIICETLLFVRIKKRVGIPEIEITRKAVKNTNNLENILELQFHPSKKHLTREVRSTWLPLHNSISNLSLEYQVDGGYLKDLAKRLRLRGSLLAGATV